MLNTIAVIATSKISTKESDSQIQLAYNKIKYNILGFSEYLKPNMINTRLQFERNSHKRLEATINTKWSCGKWQNMNKQRKVTMPKYD